MDDSFRVRVDKIFGCLASSSFPPAPSSASNSLWCLTDDEIERREWNRDKGIHEPQPQPQPQTRPDHFPAFFDGRRSRFESNSIHCENELLDDLDELDDGLEDEPCLSRSSIKSTKPDGYGEEEWEIKSSIGLDCTLDFEEEEDEYDKIAVGKKASEGLFMKDVNDYEIDIDSCNILPTSVNHIARDPRANHIAAKLRLKEDAEAAEKRDSLQVSQNNAVTGVESVELNSSEIPRSILKRKDEPFVARPQKRVQFVPECKNNTSDEDEEESKDAAMEIFSSGTPSVSNEASFSVQVPDYIRNPSRYTHYTFDSWSDVDEESNKKAYMDFLALAKRSQSSELQPEDASNLSKSVTFIPRRKTSDTAMIENITQNHGGFGKEPIQQRPMPISIPAAKAENNKEVCDMEEDELEKSDGRRSSSQTAGRQYRRRTKVVEND